jgi:N-acetylglucosamine malate deacetylase 1
MTDILAFGTHPDDIEFGCGGILAKASSQGHSILLVDLTSGEKSSSGNSEIRQQEGRHAAQLIGANRLYLDFVDSEIFDSYEGRLKLVKILREYKPRLVLAPVWQEMQNHPDHVATALMVRYACRYARFSKILPELAPHRVDGVLHYLPQVGGNADFIIDISDHFDTWKQMMESHQSQMKTYPYAEWMIKNAAQLGGLIGKNYAQGLLAANPIEIEDVMTLRYGIREI